MKCGALDMRFAEEVLRNISDPPATVPPCVTNENRDPFKTTVVGYPSEPFRKGQTSSEFSISVQKQLLSWPVVFHMRRGNGVEQRSLTWFISLPKRVFLDQPKVTLSRHPK